AAMPGVLVVPFHRFRRSAVEGLEQRLDHDLVLREAEGGRPARRLCMTLERAPSLISQLARERMLDLAQCCCARCAIGERARQSCERGGVARVKLTEPVFRFFLEAFETAAGGSGHDPSSVAPESAETGRKKVRRWACEPRLGGTIPLLRTGGAPGRAAE